MDTGLNEQHGPAEALLDALSGFRARVNQHARVQSLLRDWTRVVRLECEDVELRYRVYFAGAQMQEITPDAADSVKDADITMRAARDVLVQVFDGRLNPAKLFSDGELQIFASDKDQTKLDAISLLLWD